MTMLLYTTYLCLLYQSVFIIISLKVFNIYFQVPKLRDPLNLFPKELGPQQAARW